MMNNENFNDFVTQLKLDIFNIIADQESKLSGLVEYLNQQPAGSNTDQLVDMYNRQRNIIGSLTILTNDWSTVVTQLFNNENAIRNIINNMQEPVNETTESYDLPVTNELVNDAAPENISTESELATDLAPENTDVNGSEVVENTVVDSIADISDENAVTPVEEITNVAVETPVEEVKEPEKEASAESADVIVETPAEEVKEEVKEPEKEAVESKTKPENVIQVKADSLDGVDESNNIASLSEEQVDETSVSKIDFIALNPEFSRAILINKKQAGKLRSSLPSQKELFYTFTVKSKDNNITITADNIEEMLDKATELYGAGKVDESEKLMQKIDAFRETQTSISK